MCSLPQVDASALGARSPPELCYVHGFHGNHPPMTDSEISPESAGGAQGSCPRLSWGQLLAGLKVFPSPPLLLWRQAAFGAIHTGRREPGATCGSCTLGLQRGGLKTASYRDQNPAPFMPDLPGLPSAARATPATLQFSGALHLCAVTSVLSDSLRPYGL